ncbi:hypothetical protein BA953_22840 [Vibrio coralliilyticus]|nr:hypothetical protein BA953_22840 [Vibrio coralliilyticus]
MNSNDPLSFKTLAPIHESGLAVLLQKCEPLRFGLPKTTKPILIEYVDVKIDLKAANITSYKKFMQLGKRGR